MVEHEARVMVENAMIVEGEHSLWFETGSVAFVVQYISALECTLDYTWNSNVNVHSFIRIHPCNDEVLYL